MSYTSTAKLSPSLKRFLCSQYASRALVFLRRLLFLSAEFTFKEPNCLKTHIFFLIFIRHSKIICSWIIWPNVLICVFLTFAEHILHTPNITFLFLYQFIHFMHSITSLVKIPLFLTLPLFISSDLPPPLLPTPPTLLRTKSLRY